MKHGTEAFYQDPAFWVAASFVIFIALGAKYIWPAIGRTLDKRADAIKDQLEQATRLRNEAELLLAEYARQKEAMLKDAETILATAQRDAAAIRAKAAEELTQSLARRRQQAEESIARAEADAVAQLRAHLVDVATEATRGVVAKQLQDQKDDPAIGRALAAIERSMH